MRTTKEQRIKLYVGVTVAAIILSAAIATGVALSSTNPRSRNRDDNPEINPDDCEPAYDPTDTCDVTCPCPAVTDQIRVLVMTRTQGFQHGVTRRDSPTYAIAVALC